MRHLRLLSVGWVLHFKMLSRSSFNSVLGIVYPLFFATVAFFLFREGSPHALLYASLGASVMGIWSATSTAAGGALQRERWHGTLELLVAAPAHFSLVMLPITLAMSWLICGFLVPLSLSPGWVRPISWLLAPTWGMRAIREAAIGGSALPDIGMCAALGAAYTLLGVLIVGRLLQSARARATLSLT